MSCKTEQVIIKGAETILYRKEDDPIEEKLCKGFKKQNS